VASVSNKIEHIKDTERPLHFIFFLFGLGVMSWVPRFPEVKKNLGLTNGEFGSLLSIGSLGALLALMTVGHFVNHFGNRHMLWLSASTFSIGIALIVHITNPILFAICNVIIGASISAFNIAINSQTLTAQAAMEKLLLPKTAGIWSSGALIAILLNGFIVTHVTLSWHIGIVSAISLIGIFINLQRISPHMVPPTPSESSQLTVIFKFWKMKVDWFFCLIMLLAIQIEFSMADWATIYTTENLKSRVDFAAYPYLVFLAFMIVGRLGIGKFSDKYEAATLLKFGAIVGGAGYCFGVFASHLVLDQSQTLSFFFFLIAMGLGGLGASFLAPLFINEAQKRSAKTYAVVIGEIGAINIAMVFVMKGVIAWIAQLFGLFIGMLIPGLMLLGVVFASQVLKPKSDSENAYF